MLLTFKSDIRKIYRKSKIRMFRNTLSVLLLVEIVQLAGIAQICQTIRLAYIREDKLLPLEQLGLLE
jgi:hypothetical protein